MHANGAAAVCSLVEICAAVKYTGFDHSQFWLFVVFLVEPQVENLFKILAKQTECIPRMVRDSGAVT